MLDDRAKKLFSQLDDEMPGPRANSLELLREHLKGLGRKFCDLIADFEKAMPPEKVEELRQKLAECAKANEKAQKNEASLKREVGRLKAELKAALWVKANWKLVGAGAAALFVLGGGIWSYERYWSRSEAVNAGLHAAALNAAWAEGWGEPIAAKIGGEHYWLLYRGDIDASSYSDNRGNPIEMRCVHLYAAPAQPYSSQFYTPSPRNFLGWVSWPELAMNCKPSPTQRADTSK